MTHDLLSMLIGPRRRDRHDAALALASTEDAVKRPCARCGVPVVTTSLVRERWCLPCGVRLGQVEIANLPEARAADPRAPGLRKPKTRNPFHIPHTDYHIEQGAFW